MNELIKRKDAIEITWQDPYYSGPVNVLTGVRERIKALPAVDAVPESELFDLFDWITSAWNGKQRFFPQEDGTIYDRNKCDYVKSLDDAVNRFCEELCKDECATVNHGEWLEKTVFDSDDANIDQWQSCKCSACGRYDTRPYMYYFSEPQYCSFCGADMRKGE